MKEHSHYSFGLAVSEVYVGAFSAFFNFFQLTEVRFVAFRRVVALIEYDMR